MRFRVYHSKMHLYGQAWRMWYKQAWRGSNVSPHIPTKDFANIDFWIGTGGVRNPSIIAGMIWSGLFSTTSAKLSIPHLLQLQLSFSFHIRLYIDLDQLIWNHGFFTWNAKSSESSNSLRNHRKDWVVWQMHRQAEMQPLSACKVVTNVSWEQAERIGIQRSKTIQEYLDVFYFRSGTVSTHSDFTIVIHGIPWAAVTSYSSKQEFEP